MRYAGHSLCIVHCALCMAVASAYADATASASASPITVDTRKGELRTIAPRDIGYSPAWCGAAADGAYAVIEKGEHAGMFNAATSPVKTGDPNEEGVVSLSPAAGGARCSYSRYVYNFTSSLSAQAYQWGARICLTLKKTAE